MYKRQDVATAKEGWPTAPRFGGALGPLHLVEIPTGAIASELRAWKVGAWQLSHYAACLLYTSDAADERSSVDLGGRRIIKNKTKKKKNG